jgi:hypothetical protein
MKQIKVKKTETTKDGVQERIMMLPEPTWKRIVNDRTPLRNVKWELLDAEPQKAVAKELIAPVGTAHLAASKAAKEEVESNSPDYNNYSDAELRDACKNAGIKFSNAETRDKLIAKLKA